MPDDVVGQDVTPDSSAGYEGYAQIAAQPEVTETPEVSKTPAPTDPTQQEQVPFHNHPRWKEVNDQLKAYRQFGDTNTIQERLAQREAYENYILSQWRQAKLVEQQQKQRGLAVTTDSMSQEDREVRDKIISLFPHLKDAERRTSDFESQREIQQQTIVARGRDVLTGYANSVGVNTPLGHSAMENAITAIIESNEGALNRFRGGDPEIITHAVRALDAYVFEPIRRAAISNYVSSKQKTVGLPRTAGTNVHGIPAQPGRKSVSEMTPKESLDLEWAILNSDRK